MRKKFSKLMTISMITSIMLILLGIVLLFYTKMSLELVAYIIAVILVINGVLNITDDYKQFKIFYFFDGFTSGLLSAIFGIIIISNQSYIGVILPTFLGLWMILGSTFKLRMALALKDSKDNNWIITYILSILTIATGLCLIFNPGITSLSLIRVIAGLTIIYGICDIVDVYIFKKNLKVIAKVFE